MRQNEWQKLDVKKITRALKKHTRILYVAPTGAGKTRIAGKVVSLVTSATKRGKRAVVVAHTADIVRQIKAEFERQGIKVGVRMGTSEFNGLEPEARVQICSIQTLSAREDYPRADLLIVDECHHLFADTYRALLDHYAGTPTIGFTATPIKMNRSGMREFFEEMILSPMPSQLVEWGHLAKPIIYSHDVPETKGIPVVAGDYQKRGLDRAYNKPKLIGDIVSHWQRKAKGKRTIAFAISVVHSRRIAAAFKKAGIVAEHIDGDTPTEERLAVLARLASGKTKVVCTCGLIGEGFDLPSVECAILARPTRSLIVYLQQCGRVLRPFVPESGPLKGMKGIAPVILDHSGNAKTFGFPIDDRPWTLDGLPKQARGGMAPVKSCPEEECGAVVPAGTTECPECGHMFDMSERGSVEEEDGELVRMRPPTKEEIDAEYARVLNVAKTIKGIRTQASAEAFAKLYVMERFGRAA